MSTTPEHDDIETPLDLMAWISSGTVATREVTIHNDPALADEIDALDRQLTAAEDKIRRAGGDAPLDADDPRAELLARLEELWPQWEASKAVWTVRALSEDDIDGCYEAVPHPKQPVPPPAQAGQKAAEKHAEKIAEWAKRVHEADRERTLHLIAAAAVSIETAQGRVSRDDGAPPIVSVEVLRAMRARPHGQAWVGHIPSGKGQRITGKLATAVMAATESDGEVSRPRSPERSTTTQG